MIKRVEPDDPMALVGVGMERGPDRAALAEMARCFVDEYARMGMSGEQILRLFRSPFFRGPHQVYHELGEAFVRDLVRAVDEIRARLRPERRE